MNQQAKFKRYQDIKNVITNLKDKEVTYLGDPETCFNMDGICVEREGYYWVIDGYIMTSIPEITAMIYKDIYQ